MPKQRQTTCDSYVYEIVEKIVEEAHADLEVVLTRIGEGFPALGNYFTVRKKIEIHSH